jgi:hypothetical protein
MFTLLRIVAGILLIAHGLVHLLYLVDDTPEFRLDNSWVVPHDASRPVGVTLMAATIASSVLLGLAIWGVPWLSGAWPLFAMAAAVTSLVLLTAFWNNRLVVGVAINVALIALVAMRPEWTQQIG